MNTDLPKIPADRAAQLRIIERAAADAVREALRRHMLLGESVAAPGENGEVRILSPEEIREALRAACDQKPQIRGQRSEVSKASDL